eukprot:768730-Hanusia_phi.AAC.1
MTSLTLSQDIERIDRYCAAFHVVLLDHAPKLACKLRQAGVDARCRGGYCFSEGENNARLYLLKWWMTAFASVLPIQKASRYAWDWSKLLVKVVQPYQGVGHLPARRLRLPPPVHRRTALQADPASPSLDSLTIAQFLKAAFAIRAGAGEMLRCVRT